MERKSMLCQISASSFQKGEMILPGELGLTFLDKIPENVYLRVRNGEAWCAVYRRHDACIVNLRRMMSFYSIKPYNVVLLEYKGDANFGMEIFNNDTIEIDYPRRIYGVKKPCVTVRSGSEVENSIGNLSDIEVEKMAARFFYNASSNSRLSYNVIIRNEHLVDSDLVQVLSEEDISNLGLHESMRWIELCLQQSKWVINLIWQNGQVFFNEEWSKFTKLLNLKEGDLCVIERSMHVQRFNVAIFEKNEGSTVNVEGTAYSELKFFKIISDDMCSGGDLELPKQFLEHYGGMLKKKVNIFMPDGSNYGAQFCEVNNLLFDLKGLFSKYGLGQRFFLFFDYVGLSSLYLSVYSPLCVDIFNGNPNKFSVKEIRRNFVPQFSDVADSSDSSSDESSENSSTDDPHLEITITSDESDSICVISEHSLQDTYSDSRLNNLDGENNYANPSTEFEHGAGLIYFTVSLKASHVHQRGHGVYFARHLLSIYRPWRNGTNVTLVYDRRTWNVLVHRKKKVCRFGLGWDNFTKDNKFYVGQKLQFVYEDNRTFNVFMLP